MDEYAVIFDMDGVLIDSYRAHYESWRVTAASRDIDMTPEIFAETFGQINIDIIPRLMPGATEDDIEQWSAEKEAAYRDIIAHDFPAMPGACALVSALRADGARLAVGSSGPRENVECVLAALPCGDCFAVSVCRPDVEKGKPDPEVFLAAAERLEVPPARCAVIEDAVVGLDAARAAGMAAIGITGTEERERLLGRAHHVIESFTEIDPAGVKDIIERAGGTV